MEEEKPVHKRVVIHHVTGRLQGMAQIMGALDQPWDTGEQYPAMMHYRPTGVREPKVANHCKTSHRTVQYREWVPGLSTEEQHAQQR